MPIVANPDKKGHSKVMLTNLDVLMVMELCSIKMALSSLGSLIKVDHLLENFHILMVILMRGICRNASLMAREFGRKKTGLLMVNSKTAILSMELSVTPMAQNTSDLCVKTEKTAIIANLFMLTVKNSKVVLRIISSVMVLYKNATVLHMWVSSKTAKNMVVEFID